MPRFLSLICLVLARLAILSVGFSLYRPFSLSIRGQVKVNTPLFAADDKSEVSNRRRKRSSSSSPSKENTEPTTTPQPAAVSQSPKPASNPMLSSTVVKNEDGTAASIEEMFGLGDSQLRDLMEDINELPVPREDLVTGEALQEEQNDANKVLQLPDLGEFVKDNTAEPGRGASSNQASKRKRRLEENLAKVDRRNQEEYMRVMQLNPFADADESLFLDEYDIIPAIFGSGKLLSIPVPYLQTGHGILLLVSLIAAFVYDPGNPLTAFPSEIRAFLRQGLGVALSINAVLGVQAFFIAKSKDLPGLFWAFKTLLLGGVAFYEVNQARAPSQINVDDGNSSGRR